MTGVIVYATGPFKGQEREWYGMDEFFDFHELDGRTAILRYVVRDGMGYLDDVLSLEEMAAWEVCSQDTYRSQWPRYVSAPRGLTAGAVGLLGLALVAEIAGRGPRRLCLGDAARVLRAVLAPVPVVAAVALYVRRHWNPLCSEVAMNGWSL